MGRLRLGSWSLVQDLVLQAAVAASCACEACKRTSRLQCWGATAEQPLPLPRLPSGIRHHNTPGHCNGVRQVRLREIAAKPASSPAAGLLTPNSVIALASCGASAAQCTSPSCSPYHRTLILTPPHPLPSCPAAATCLTMWWLAAG